MSQVKVYKTKYCSTYLYFIFYFIFY